MLLCKEAHVADLGLWDDNGTDMKLGYTVNAAAYEENEDPVQRRILAGSA